MFYVSSFVNEAIDFKISEMQLDFIPNKYV